MLQNLVHGLSSLGSGPAIGYLVLGALIGVLLGVIPGLSGAVILSIILVFVYHIDLTGTLCLFLGTHAGMYYSASVTSILLNTPAHPEAFAVTLDGYPMAQHGEAGRALGISAVSTCIGGFVGCAVLVGFVEILNDLPGLFHPPEYIALVIIAMLLVGTLGTDSVAKAIASMGIGLLISAVGTSIITGVDRYTFHSIGLIGGVSLVGLALGLFAVPQMVMVFGTGTSIPGQDMTGREIVPSSAARLGHGFGKQVVGGVYEGLRHWKLLVQSGLIGSLTGIIPGMGGFAANFLSYGVAKQTSRKRDQFGTGIAEGIIAPEGASLAKEAGSMVPILGLSVPGSVGGALFLAALIIKGVRTGYGFTTSYPTIPYEIVWIIALAGLIGTAVGVLIGPQLAKITRVPGPILVPFIFVLSVVGTFLADVSFFAVVEVLVFGIMGLVLRRLRYSLASFVLGLVLGPTFETNIYLMHNIYPGLTFVKARPFADVLFVIAAGILVMKAKEIRREKKAARVADEAVLDGIVDELTRAEAIREQKLKRASYPLLSLITTFVLLAVSSYFVAYAFLKFNFETGIFPEIAGLLVVVPMLFRIPIDTSAYILYRRMQSANAQLVLAGAASESAHGREIGDWDVTVPSTVGVAAGMVPSTETLFAAAGSSLVDVNPFSSLRLKSWGKDGQYMREMVALATLAALIGACYFFGFLWSVPVFVSAYGLIATRRIFKSFMGSLIFSAIGASVMWAVTYGMFNIVHLPFVPRVHL